MMTLFGNLDLAMPEATSGLLNYMNLLERDIPPTRKSQMLSCRSQQLPPLRAGKEKHYWSLAKGCCALSLTGTQKPAQSFSP